MIHISSNAAVAGLFRAASGLLKSGRGTPISVIHGGRFSLDGRLITYGPYGANGRIEPMSNQVFDQTLRSKNPEWGLRHVEDLTKEAEKNNLRLKGTHSMPANNKTLIFEKCN